MKLEEIAERWGRAIFELAVEAGSLSAVAEDIGRFAAVWTQSPELRTVAQNPLVAPDRRVAAVREIAQRLGLSPLGTNALALLASRRRLAVLSHVVRVIGRLSDERAGIVRATVTTAALLPDPYYDRLRAQLEQALGRKVVLEREHDPDLVAGVVTRIGDRVIDGSLRARLDDLRAQLLAD